MSLYTCVALVPLTLRFTGDTPRVVGDTVNWQFTLNRPASSVTCQVSRNDKRDCEYECLYSMGGDNSSWVVC